MVQDADLFRPALRKIHSFVVHQAVGERLGEGDMFRTLLPSRDGKDLPRVGASDSQLLRPIGSVLRMALRESEEGSPEQDVEGSSVHNMRLEEEVYVP